ncbi:PucR family transcriptional regulator [Pseudomonas sp. NPDC089422]|uniref:PucR family transcriptional regulator n=1 Tax=Pseudomonas sp. NPDC089422 TaxID=3364466 RepID=UPI0037FA1009
MAQRIRDLIAIPELRSRIIAGHRGLDRTVRWAHAFELQDPGEWFGSGDVLMTTGLGIPRQPAQQREYLARLVECGLAGIMIGENMQAPADMSGLTESGNALGFPVIMTDYEVPFAAVTRAIIDANQQEEYERRTILANVYESARLGMQGLGLPAVLERLAKDIHCSLYLVTCDDHEPWSDALPVLPESLRDALALGRNRSKAQQSIVRRHQSPNGELHSIELSNQQGCLLVIVGEHLPDYALLHHLTVVLALETQRVQADLERHLRLGSELLDDLLQRRLLVEVADARLRDFLPGTSLQNAVISVARLDHDTARRIDATLRKMDIGALVRRQADQILLLHDHSLLDEYAQQLGVALGASGRLETPYRVPEALREAWVAHSHTHRHRPVCSYADLETDTPWVPRTPDEAARAFMHVLGAVHQYDKANNTALIQSLRMLLEENRSWLKAAKRLHVHKQTLVYRIRRVEEISGRSLDCTADVATLWFALQNAWAIEEGQSGGS